MLNIHGLVLLLGILAYLECGCVTGGDWGNTRGAEGAAGVSYKRTVT